MVQFCDDPKKNIHKIFIPPKNIHFSENPKKYWNSKFRTQNNDPSLRMYDNIRVTPSPTPPLWGLSSWFGLFSAVSANDAVKADLALELLFHN